MNDFEQGFVIRSIGFVKREEDGLFLIPKT